MSDIPEVLSSNVSGGSGDRSHTPLNSKHGTQKMKPVWKAKARNFEAFPRRDENPKPSDWWLLVFASRLMGVTIIGWVTGTWERFYVYVRKIEWPSNRHNIKR
jgi:hypothetical protein